MNHLSILYDRILKTEENPCEMLSDNSIHKLLEIVEECCAQASEMSRTGKLWIQYYRQVSLIRMYLHAERQETGHFICFV